MKLILEKAKHQLNLNLPFVVFKKPNNTLIKGVFQKNDTLFLINDLNEKGFVFASFDGKTTILIPDSQSEIYSEAYQENRGVMTQNIAFYSSEVDRNDFESLVARGIEAIKNEEFKKVVLSRKESVDLSDFDVFTAFENLVFLYPSAFTYCFYHPKVGVWLGASPEQLLKSTPNKFETIALAGTQKDIDIETVEWKNKEIEEQQIVTDYIVNKLNTVAENLVVSKPYSFKAGNLWHIKTDISGVFQSDFSLQKTILLLHPTPAVCGLPKEPSKAFILENENYNRLFYTGFLGELNTENTSGEPHSDLFVNLRCMEIEYQTEDDFSKKVFLKANIYVGCGITKDSIPQKEWQESVNKSMTMKRIIDYKF